MKHPKAALLGDLFGLKQSLSAEGCDGFVRFDPPKLCVPVALSIGGISTINDVKDVWLMSRLPSSFSD
jgi:hypothetical protein